MALGVEVSFERFGKESLLKPDTASNSTSAIDNGHEWSTSMYSVLGEYQYDAQSWLTIAGFRADQHSFTDIMFSTRLAFIHMISEENFFKFIFNRSVRRADDGDLFTNYHGDFARDVETMDNFELRHEIQKTSNLWFATSAYYNAHTVLAWDSSIAAIMVTTWRIGVPIQQNYFLKMT